MQATADIQQDIRDIIFASISDKRYTASLVAENHGIISGIKRLQAFFADWGISAEIYVKDGDSITAGTTLATFTGLPKQIAVAEEVVVGLLSKPSGIATAARRAIEAAGPELAIVCGAWKKMPAEIKHIVREAVVSGGASFRITNQPFLYLDKNFVRMLGGIEATLKSVAEITDKLKVIQLKGDTGDIVAEALTAARCGADIIMVDTGFAADVTAINKTLIDEGCRHRVKLAFAKGITLNGITELTGTGIDILDIGTCIVDAPLLDMKLEVER
jgi:nicotinate-nucleotide pyrophosphorylase (carboxylating)